MKASQISIKWKVFVVFLIFAIVLLSVLWFFQIVYLNDFYKLIKRNETENVMDQVEEILLNTDDCSDEIDEIAASYNIGILVADTEGNSLYNAEYLMNSSISTIPSYMFDLFYDEAVAGGGEAVIEYKGSEMQLKNGEESLITEEYTAENDSYVDEDDDDTDETDSDDTDENEQDDDVLEDIAPPEDILGLGQQNENSDETVGTQGEGRVGYTISPETHEEKFMQNIGNDMAESIIYVRIIEVNGTENVVLVNSVITPVDATVTTLKMQLKVISIIVLLIAFVIAALISNNISKSIIRLNDGAKQLAGGDYSVKFNSRDYLEVAQLTDTLNYAATELGKTDSLQKELIANVSHDLRTPLTMIKGYAEVMRDIPGENTPENVQVIIEETERLTGLVNDMLDISKLKAGTISIKPEEYNITESIRHVLERYNKLREVEGYTIDFLYDREVEVYADEQKMYQVLYNLVNNAINYTGDDKKVTVRQKISGNHLRIEVTDTGNGVRAEDIPYVWDRYYKDKTTHKRAVQGTGLGLSIVKNVLELHGAKYGVFSTPGQGATFWFELTLNPFSEEE